MACCRVLVLCRRGAAATRVGCGWCEAMIEDGAKMGTEAVVVG